MVTGGVGLREQQPAGRVSQRSRFFPVAAVLMTAIVFAGFTPSFFLRFQFRTEPLPAYLILHGLVMSAWQLLFLAQTLLIANRRPDIHRKLGLAGAGLAIAVIIVGLFATLMQPARLAEQGIVLPFPLEDLVVGNIFGFAFFGGLVATAIVRRGDTHAHKRLLYWAGIVTMGPALTPARSLGEMIVGYFPTHFPPEIALGWLAWIALMIHDWRSMLSFHPVTIIGGVLLLFVMPALLDWTLLIYGIGAWVRGLA